MFCLCQQPLRPVFNSSNGPIQKINQSSCLSQGFWTNHLHKKLKPKFCRYSRWNHSRKSTSRGWYFGSFLGLRSSCICHSTQPQCWEKLPLKNGWVWLEQRCLLSFSPKLMVTLWYLSKNLIFSWLVHFTIDSKRSKFCQSTIKIYKVIIYLRLTQNCNNCPVTRSECVEVFDQKRTFFVVSIVITVRMWC